MPHYLFVYHGGSKPETPAAGAKLMEQWQIWLTGLGDAVVERGNPVGRSKTVTARGVQDSGGANPVSGFSIIEAESMAAALYLTEGCPHLEHGTIEVAEIVPV